MMRMTRGFVWLQEALGIERAPDTVRDDVQPSIDAAQDGWAHRDTEILPFAYTVSVTAPPQTFDLLEGVDVATREIAPDQTRQIVVLDLSVTGGTSALPGDVWLTYRANVTGTIIVHSVATMGCDLTVASGSAVIASPLANSQAFLPRGHLWCPRGFRPQLRIYAFDDVTVAGCAAIMRAGFRAGAP